MLAGALACVQARENPKRANKTLDWIEAQTDAAGHLGEQSSSHLRKPESLEPWVQRRGPPARPLLWSNALCLLGVSAFELATIQAALQPKALVANFDAEIANLREALTTASEDAAEEMRDLLAVAEKARLDTLRRVTEMARMLDSVSKDSGE